MTTNEGAVTANLFADLPTHLPDELITTLLAAPNARIERIVSHGTPPRKGFGTTKTSTNGWWC